METLNYDTDTDDSTSVTDIFETSLEQEELNILHLSHDPISAALHPIDRTSDAVELITHELQSSHAYLGHMDGGSMATTTDQKHLLYDLVPLSSAPILRVADARAHTPTHIGKLNLKVSHQEQPLPIKCFYTPTLPVTIISPTSITKTEQGSGYSATANLSGNDCQVIIHKQQQCNDIRVPCLLKHGLLFAHVIDPQEVQQTLVMSLDVHGSDPSSQPLECHEIVPPDDSSIHDDHEMLREVTHDDESMTTDDTSEDRARLRQLWHQRLNHINFRLLGDMHKHVKGVPKLGKPHPLDKCATCMKEKLRKANSRKTSSRRSTIPNQGISIDFGFIVQASSTDDDRVSRLQGLNGETCYCLIADHFSGALYGECFETKAAPLRFINSWLAKHAPRGDVRDKYVRMDLGGELGRSHDVVTLFENAGYSIEFTSPNHSHQNGPVERPHQTIAGSLRTMLHGANLEAKYWPYAFHHFLRTYNVTPHGELHQSPTEIITQRKPNLAYLRTFGCPIIAIPPRSRRPDKLHNAPREGIFMGFSRTSKNILYLDNETHSIRYSSDVEFDEAHETTKVLSPNAESLQRRASTITKEEQQEHKSNDVEMEVSSTPWINLKTVSIKLNDLNYRHGIGISYEQCHKMHRPFISTIHQAFKGSKIRPCRRKYLKAYIIAVNDQPVFNTHDVDKLVSFYQNYDEPPSFLEFTLCTEAEEDFHLDDTPIHLRLHQIRSSHQRHLRRQREVSQLMAYGDLLVQRLHAENMTDEEKSLPSLTRKNLRKLSNWDVWDKAYDDQLDKHHEAGVLGEPILRTSLPPEEQCRVLRMHWTNVVKTDGRRKSRCCLDGSRRAAPWLRIATQTYSSCIETPCMRLFLALAAQQGMVVNFGDTTNAFQQSPPPTKRCYVAIDDAYQSWRIKRFGSCPDPKLYVIPLLRNLQGHPEAGVCFERLVNEILQNKMGFKNTTHEKNLYRGKHLGQDVLICRQVDDFAVASTDLKATQSVLAAINAEITTDDMGMGEITDDGILSRYNGLDIHQTQDYIKISCENYIDRMLRTHGWSEAGHHESDIAAASPISPTACQSLQMEEGPPEGTKAHTELSEKMGFSYRQVLGELMYAYVIVRCDIGYAVTFLARYSQNPSSAHYKALKGVAKYLRATKDYGIFYWRGKPRSDLPKVSIPPIEYCADLPSFPVNTGELTCYVDAAHATDLKTRRSVTGYGICYGGGVVAYKSKLQATCSTSSTEAEFIAVVTASKTIKYLRTVLEQLGYPCDKATSVYVDNQAAIAMVNEDRPTPRARHIDIQHFAIQEWRKRGVVTLHHIPGVINPSDAATKPLGWILHKRHVLRMMGYYGLSSM